MEVAVAIVVVAIIAAVAFSGETRQLQHVAESFAETKAGRLVSSRMECLRAEARPPAEGVIEFSIDSEATAGLIDAVGSQRVRRLEPGLFEIEVEISWMPTGATKRRRFGLMSWMDWENRR